MNLIGYINNFHRPIKYLCKGKREPMEKASSNKRIVNTRNAINSAFKDMISKMKASDITVKELTQKAGIHRKTFYSHYASIEDLYDFTLNEIISGFIALIESQLAIVDLKFQTRAFFEYFSQQEPFVEKIICDSSYREYCNVMFYNSIDRNTSYKASIASIDVKHQSSVTAFLVSATLELYRQWVKDGKVLDLEEEIALASTLLFEGYNGLFAKQQ